MIKKAIYILKLTLYGIGILLVLLIMLFYIVGGGFGERQTDFASKSSLLFAHRGNSKYFVQNSAEAFKSSKELGFKAFEADLNITKDGALILFHDKNCLKLLGVDSIINTMPLKHIQKHDLLFQNNKTQSKVLAFNELLRIAGDSICIYIDIKKSKLSIADSILKTLKKENKYDQLLIADGNPFFLCYLKYQDPKAITILEDLNAGYEWLYALFPKNFKPDYCASYLEEVNEKHMAWFKDKGIIHKKIVYGVKPENIKQLKSFGIQHAIIDYDSSYTSFLEMKKQIIYTP